MIRLLPRPLLALLAFVAVLALAGCESVASAPGPESRPDRLVVYGEMEFTDTVGQTLPSSPRLRVLDPEGEPVRGAEVTWTVTKGGGSVGRSTSTTDGKGTASTTWTLGTISGTNKLVATVEALRLIFTAVATADAAASAEAFGDGQTGFSNAPLPARIGVRVLDRNRNPLPGSTVTFQTGPGPGSGTITPASLTTDAAGLATVTWTLGTGAGAQTATARVGGIELAFSATAVLGQPGRLDRISGDGQSAIAGDTLPEPVVVRVTDASSNPLPGIPVAWTVTSGGGSVPEATSVTDASGLARTRWVLGASEEENTLSASVASVGSVTFTATGRVPSRIVFVGHRHGNAELYSLQASTGVATRLTVTQAEEGNPSVSADGSLIAFRSNRDGNAEIYLMNADGTGVRRLTNHPGVDQEPAISPDGRRVAWVSSRNGGLQIHLMNADGTGAVAVTDNGGTNTRPAWSPDGSRLAFASDLHGLNGPVEIYLVNPDGSALTRVTSLQGRTDHPAWAPDGTRLAVRTVSSAGTGIAVLSVDGRSFRRITDDAGYYPAWSPDGARIVYANRDELLTVRPDGSDRTTAASGSGSEADPAWTR